jgi:hypothetical protein
MTDDHLHLRLHRRLKNRTSVLDTTGEPVGFRQSHKIHIKIKESSASKGTIEVPNNGRYRKGG